MKNLNHLIKFLQSHNFNHEAGYIKRFASDYIDEGMVGDKWGSRGSGILYVYNDEILLLKRSPYVLEPNTWGIPGGAVPKDKDGNFKSDWESAAKESEEETGYSPERNVIGTYVFTDKSFIYTTYFVKVNEKFTPSLNWESSDFAWININDVTDYQLHYGVISLLKNSNIKELLGGNNDSQE
jgi:8-oxo-dGTP pyrophosphatase MutT (NUDIX family)